ncbi:glycosyltransferase family 1 protein [Inquilinus sp. KBS0705]|nr:glycosyltransferase family 1 protein [Inquilinus sp. KBS0705]
MSKVRVAFFAEILTEDFDGAVRTIYQIINRIDKHEFEYLFIYGAGPAQIAGFKSLKVPSVALPFNSHYSIALPALAKAKLTATLNEFRPDVVHVSTPSYLGKFGVNYAAKKHLRVMTIYHTHFISYLDYYLKYAPFLVKWAKKIMGQSHRVFYNNCDKVYVPSESLKEELASIGILSAKMKIWKRGIDNILFNPAKKDARLIRQLTGNNHPTILFVSRLVWEKNLETLFEIYDSLQNSQPNLNFLIVGDGIAKKACKERMPKAIFVGRADHNYLAELYASSDVFLFPSVSETYGNVVAEAMASGLPCIIADGGGSKDFIIQGVNGFKCEPYKASDYKEKIEQLLCNRQLRHQFVCQGLQCSNQLTWHELATVYFNDVTQMANKAVLELA